MFTILADPVYFIGHLKCQLYIIQMLYKFIRYLIFSSAVALESRLLVVIILYYNKVGNQPVVDFGPHKIRTKLFNINHIIIL